MKEQVIQSPIVKVFILLIILVAFGGIIFAISFAFATKCPTGQTYDKDQQKCIKTCIEGKEVYDTDTNDCRPLCGDNEVWSRSTNKCQKCPVGSTWNENSQECLLYCSDTTQCTTQQSCVEGKCCNYKPCKTIAGDKCCQTCTPDTQNTGYSTCCPPEKTYVENGQTKCCPGGQISKNGTECADPCGPIGSNKLCGSNTECITIKNVDSVKNPNIFNQLNSNKDNLWEQNSDKTYNFYTCMSNKDLCNSSNSFAGPAETANFYPCFDMANKNKNEILAYTKDTINQFNSTLGEGQGYYCNNGGGQDLSRLYGVQLDTNKCDYTNCIAMLANPSVTDVYYDAKTGNCTSIQSCTDNISKLQTSIDNKNLGFLQSCKDYPNIDVCKNLSGVGQYCDNPNTGLIQTKGYQCIRINNPPNSVGTKSVNDIDGSCVCYPGSVGTTCQYSRILTCSGNGAPDPNTGTCKCDTFWVGTNCNTKQLSTDYYNQAWILNYVQQLRNTIISAPNNVKVDNVFGWENFVVILINNNGKLTYKDWNTNGTGGQYVTGVWVDPDAANPKSNAQVERHFLTPRQQGNGRGVSFQLLSTGGGPTYNLIFNINDASDHGGIWYQLGTDQGYGRTDGIPSTPPPPPMSILLIQPNICVIYCTKYADGTNN